MSRPQSRQEPADRRCAACGYAHRYDTADPEHDYDPIACINTLRGVLERSRKRAWQLLGELGPGDD